MKRFGSYANGFTLTFDNGLVLSTRFGFMNYCENRNNETYMNAATLFSEDCEIAVWDSTATTFDVEEHETHDWATGSRDWVTGWQEAVFNQEAHDDVRGWVSFSDWLKVVEWCEQKEKA
tara:strand:+ start:435 stop:791 length:357 start_codon:yes stop_codon:yes gene_type:complete